MSRLGLARAWNLSSPSRRRCSSSSWAVWSSRSWSTLPPPDFTTTSWMSTETGTRWKRCSLYWAGVTSRTSSRSLGSLVSGSGRKVHRRSRSSRRSSIAIQSRRPRCSQWMTTTEAGHCISGSRLLGIRPYQSLSSNLRRPDNQLFRRLRSQLVPTAQSSSNKEGPPVLHGRNRISTTSERRLDSRERRCDQVGSLSVSPKMGKSFYFWGMIRTSRRCSVTGGLCERGTTRTISNAELGVHGVGGCPICPKHVLT